MKRKILALISIIALVLPLTVNAQSDAGTESGSEGMSTTVGVGAVVMDGETWQQVTLRPDIPLGKFGIGLDITLYFDSEGNLRQDDWDEPADIIDKIYYLRYGHKGDPVYVRAGALDRVTIGYGLLMKRYSNSIEYPDVKRVGAEWDLTLGKMQLEGMINNFREIQQPGLLGLRASYPVLGKLRLGAGVIHDGNQYASFHDTDDDNVPDEIDLFNDADDGEVIGYWEELYQSNPEAYQSLLDSGIPGVPDPVLFDNGVSNYADSTASLTAFSFDIAYPMLDRKLVFYGQAAQFVDYGFGFAFPGVRFTPFHFLTMGAEYRDYQDEFIPEYFNTTYELERYSLTQDASGNQVLAPKSRLQLSNAKAAAGVYADLSLNVYNILEVFAAYTTMKPKDEGVNLNSLFGRASLNVSKVPKLSDLSAYYQQTNVESLLDLQTESTVYGYRIGYEAAANVNIYLNYRFTFRDLDGNGLIEGDNEKIRSFEISTAFGIN